mgnify:CR=1 FL=1
MTDASRAQAVVEGCTHTIREIPPYGACALCLAAYAEQVRREERALVVDEDGSDGG